MKCGRRGVVRLCLSPLKEVDWLEGAPTQKTQAGSRLALPLSCWLHVLFYKVGPMGPALLQL